MSAKQHDYDPFFTKSSLFQSFSPEFPEISESQFPTVQGEFAISLQTVRLELFEKVLKLTFLTPKDEKSSIPHFLKLDYDIKAVELTFHKDDSGQQKFGFSLFKSKLLVYNFECHDKELAANWIKELSKVIFLSGFSNQFKALKYIGRGQFAQVWEMERLRDGKKFAVKIIDKETSFGQVNGREAVYNEIEILRKINHPNIEKLQCIYESEKSIYLVLQYIPGFVLSDLIRKKKTGSESESSGKIEKCHNVNIMKNLLKAVKYLHDLGIAHRDIKPGNIIIDPMENWKPYIIDFGLSQFTSKEEFLFQCCGSPGYMAPQIFTRPNQRDLLKCDIFSLGAIFFFLLTHEPLFDGNSTQEIIQQTKNCKSFIRKKIKSSLEGVQAHLLMEMLEEDPQKRLTIEEALSHDFFLQAVYDYMNELRKPTSEGEPTRQYSVKQRKFNSKFEQLFSESVVFIEFKLNLVNQEEKQNVTLNKNTNHNMVEPSQEFIEKINRRSSRYMSEEIIDISAQLKQSQKIKKVEWSGKWKRFKTLDSIFVNGNFWNFRDFNAG